MSEDEKWKSNLLIEIAGEAWRDEPELLGAVGSACDLLRDVLDADELVRGLTPDQLEHVRKEMAGIREALISLWVALEEVAPSDRCLGSLCVHRGHERVDDSRQRVPRRRQAHGGASK